MFWVPGSGPEGPRGPSGRFWPVLVIPAQAPTPGPLILPEWPDPENPEKACFLHTFWAATFRTPFPSRRFLLFLLKRCLKKGPHYIDFFD